MTDFAGLDDELRNMWLGLNDAITRAVEKKDRPDAWIERKRSQRAAVGLAGRVCKAAAANPSGFRNWAKTTSGAEF